MVDYKALIGDVSDNLKGVPGIGPRTATDILQKYGTLEKALLHTDEKPALKLAGQEEIARKSKWMVTLKCDIPLNVDSLEDLAVPDDEERILEYFEHMGFSSLAKRLLGNGGTPKPAAKKKGPDVRQGSIF